MQRYNKEVVMRKILCSAFIMIIGFSAVSFASDSVRSRGQRAKREVQHECLKIKDKEEKDKCIKTIEEKYGRNVSVSDGDDSAEKNKAK